MPPKVVFTWPSYYTRMNDVDPDHRQMALFDFTRQLQVPEFVIGAEEDKMVETVKKCFGKDEHNSEVHSHAVKILPVLFPKIQKRSRDAFANVLSKGVWENIAGATKEELHAVRENCSMALKTLSECLTEEHRDNVEIMVTGLLPGFNSPEGKIRNEIFEVLVDIVRAFGGQLPEAQLDAMQAAAIKDLTGDQALRKRATALLAAVCAFSKDAQFAVVVDLTISGLSKEKGDRLRRNIYLCTAIARAAGGRFAGSVTRVIPLLLNEIRRLDGLEGEERESPESDDTREQVLQAFECFIARCPHFVIGLLPEIIAVCSTLIKWDPNYCEDPDALPEDDDGEDQGAIDDDDTSWKVRKAAAKCARQILASHPSALAPMLAHFFASPSPLLVSRLNERIENVRLEVFELLRRVLELSCIVKEPVAASGVDGEDQATHSGSYVFGSFRLALDVRPEAKPVVDAQDPLVRCLIHSANHKSLKIKIASFSMLHDLFMLLGRNLAVHLPECATLLKTHLTGVKYAQPNLRPEVLRFGRCVIVCARNVPQGTAIQPLPVVLPLLEPVCIAMEDRFFKTVVSAIKVGLEFVGLLRGSGNAAAAATLFRALKARMSAADSDVEVKKAAIEAMAMLIRHHADGLKGAVGEELNQALDALLNLMKHDATRVPAARAFATVGGQSCVTPALAKAACTELTVLLRRADRSVREAALRTLIAVVPVHGKSLDATIVEGIAREVVSEASSLMSEKELFLASLSLQLCSKLARLQGHGQLLKNLVAPRVVALLSSIFAQGHVVREAAEFYRALTGRGEVPVPELLNPVLAAAKAAPPTAVSSLAAVVGSIVGADANQAQAKAFVDSLSDLARADATAIVGLACLGEVGRSISLGTASPKGVEVLKQRLVSPSEDIRMAAAVAYGRAAATESGAPLFSTLVTDLASKADQRLTLLRALREALATAASGDSSDSGIPFVRDATTRAQLTGQLLQLAESSEDAADLFAECLGRLAQLEPAATVSELATVVGSPSSSEARIATAIGAVRHALGTSHSRKQLDDVVQSQLGGFLVRLNRDQPLRVRRQALHLLLTVAYSRASLLTSADIRATALPAWLTELEVDRRFVTEVDLGPFKHKVDKGIEVRKLAFETLATLAEGLSRPPSVLEVFGRFSDVVGRTVEGLKDPDAEIVRSATTTLVKLARFHASAAEITPRAATVFDNLKVSVNAKDPQEPEKAVETSKHAIIAAFRLVASIPELTSAAKFIELRDAAKVLPHFEQAVKAASE